MESILKGTAEARVKTSDVRCTFYRNRKPILKARAPAMELNSGTQTAVLSGGVTADAPQDGASLSVKTLSYHADSYRAFGKGGFRFVRDKLIFTGQSISWNVAQKTAEFTGSPQLEWQPAGGKVF